ncbi:unnamed protein product [Nesidiocoris tenuis]|uniref:Uncharacterized protein n=1 Tax=Nesidiocoris tenuis TaxID=355587 RepID=A0A6H5HGD7_9HEMI|nr:unnamed protein product [Nesidiocoris tenuis]
MFKNVRAWRDVRAGSETAIEQCTGVREMRRPGAFARGWEGRPEWGLLSYIGDEFIHRPEVDLVSYALPLRTTIHSRTRTAEEDRRAMTRRRSYCTSRTIS